MNGSVKKERVGVHLSGESSTFIYNTLKERYKNNPPSPRTKLLAAALISSSEPFSLNSEAQGNENKKPIMNSTAEVDSCARKTAGVKGGKIINGRASRTHYGEVENPLKGRRVWTLREDDFTRKLVNKHGTGSWTLVAECLASQHGIPGRTGKQCWER